MRNLVVELVSEHVFLKLLIDAPLALRAPSLVFSPGCRVVDSRFQIAKYPKIGFDGKLLGVSYLFLLGEETGCGCRVWENVLCIIG